MNKKNFVTKFDFDMAFKALDAIDYPVASPVIKQDLSESCVLSRGNKSGFKKLAEEVYNIYDRKDLETAQADREADVAKAKLQKIEKIVDLDADAVEDLLGSYVGKIIIQCPQCKTLFYKKEADLDRKEENSEIVNIGETCQHCGNTSGYEVIGKVAEETLKTDDKELPPEVADTEVSEMTADELDQAIDFNPDTAEEPEDSLSQINTGFDTALPEPELIKDQKNESLSSAAEDNSEFSGKYAYLTKAQLKELNRLKKRIVELEDELVVVEEESDNNTNKIEAVKLIKEKIESFKQRLGSVVDSYEELALAMADAEPEAYSAADINTEFNSLRQTLTESKKLVEFIFDHKSKKLNDKFANIFSVVSGTIIANKFVPSANKPSLLKDFDSAIAYAKKKSLTDKNIIWRVVGGDFNKLDPQQKIDNRLQDFKAAKSVFTNIDNILNNIKDQKVANKAQQKADKILNKNAINTEEPNTDEPTTTSNITSASITADNGVTDKEVPNIELETTEAAINTKDTDKNSAELEVDKSEPATTADVADSKSTNTNMDVLSQNKQIGDRLTRQRLNNKKIAQALKATGFNINDLYTEITTKDGRKGLKATDKLNALRKALFNEDLEEEATDLTVADIDSYPEYIDYLADIDEIQEESFSKSISNYLNEVYDNTDEFTLTKCKQTKDGKLICEGLIKFKSGISRKSSFTFEPLKVINESKAILTGTNREFSKDKAFKITTTIKNKKLKVESLSYNYKINESLVCGHIKNK